MAAGQPLLDANGQQVMDPATGQPMLAPYPADKREQATRNYELDRSISYTKQQQGRLRRLSVAVVVDDQVSLNAAGETVRVPWSADELARFTRLVQDAVGFDASRGDSVSVINTAFVADSFGEAFEDVPFYSQPWFWDVVKQVLGVLFILVLVFGVLRPVLKSLTNPASGKELQVADGAGELGEEDGLDTGLANDRVSLSGPQNILLPSPSEGYEAQLNAIKNLVADDPGRVAQVVKEWINADE
ncbi:flagellar MS-ring protein [Pseudomonas sp. BAY1663]|nr:flagellar MS-ring protein [Pseudomonas sp. BAY1663]